MLNVIMGSELIWLELRDVSLNVQGVNIRQMFYHQLIGHSERKLMVDDSLEKRIKVAHCRPRNVSIMWFFNPSLKLCGLRLPFQFKNQKSRVKSQDPTNPLLLYTLFFSLGLFYDLKMAFKSFFTGDSQLLFLPPHNFFLSVSFSCMSILQMQLWNLDILPSSL